MPASVPDAPRPLLGADDRPRVATPTDVSAAIASRLRRERRRRRMVAGAVGAVLLLALLLGWVVRFSPLLAVRTVEVHGASRVPASRVAEVAQVPVGRPLVTLDTHAIGQRVASSLAPVQKVQVRTQLPGTVVLEVTERTPVFQRQAGNQWQLVDADGVVFALMATKQPKLPVATTTSVDNRLLAGVATVVDALGPSVRARVQSVQATGPDQFVLLLDKGQKVLWGSADASADKARVLAVLLTQRATVFDVTSPGTPATR